MPQPPPHPRLSAAAPFAWSCRLRSRSPAPPAGFSPLQQGIASRSSGRTRARPPHPGSKGRVQQVPVVVESQKQGAAGALGSPRDVTASTAMLPEATAQDIPSKTGSYQNMGSSRGPHHLLSVGLVPQHLNQLVPGFLDGNQISADFNLSR
ncbi:uncharacterized protein LOC102063027 isoform X2 [Zonotrichia albicollis]|uniref:uncharacterized protein LOC102063027 isoform X2 n=1 Tax=Zonotrichia albicollis TaxID=44394 RepID=UPI003D8109C1